MARSGNYEVDAEGNLVEVGGAAATPDPAGSGEVTDGADADPTPIPVRRALHVYGFAQVVSFVVLVVTAITLPDIRALLLFVAVVYAIAAVFLHRLYRRALMRAHARRVARK